MKLPVVFLFFLLLLDGCATTVKEKTEITMDELLNMPTEKLFNLSAEQEKKRY